MRLYSMGLIQPAKLNGHDLHVCLRDVFEATPNSGAHPCQRASGPGLLGQVPQGDAGVSPTLFVGEVSFWG